MRYQLVNDVRVRVVPYTAIVFVNIVITIFSKIRLVAEDDFSAKIGVPFQTHRQLWSFPAIIDVFVRR